MKFKENKELNKKVKIRSNITNKQVFIEKIHQRITVNRDGEIYEKRKDLNGRETVKGKHVPDMGNWIGTQTTLMKSDYKTPTS